MSSFLTQEQLQIVGFGKLGINVKVSRNASIYNPRGIELGDNCRIDDFCIISAGEGGIKIGRNVHIAAYCTLMGSERIDVQDFAGISARGAIYSSNDDYSGSALTGPTIPDRFRKLTHGAVTIGKHVIVGTGTVILPGITIEEGAAIGSLSLVNRNCESFGIYAGVPAKRVKERSRDLLAMEDQYLAWLNGKND